MREEQRVKRVTGGRGVLGSSDQDYLTVENLPNTKL
jgi:hypothetical protein